MDDDDLLLAAQELLDSPTEYQLSHDHPTMQAMLRRLVELLKQEQARRAAHRPRAEVSLGRFVEILIESGTPPRRAKALAAKMRGVKPSTVKRAYRPHRHKGGDRGR